MEIRNLTTFIRVAELQSFSRAAEQLGYSQSAVTVQIRQLEQELGTLLFERIGRHVRLTEEGEALVERAVAVLRAVQEAENVGKVGRQGGGKLRIGTAESLLISVLPPVFVEFGRKCPDALLSTKTGPVEDLFEMVRQNEIDLLYFLDRKTDFPEWIKVSEHRERAIFVASAAHPLAGEKHISVERLQKEPLVLTERGISYRCVRAGACGGRNRAGALSGNGKYGRDYPAGAGKQRRFLPAGIRGEGGSGLRKAGGAFRGLPADRNVQPACLPQKQTDHSADGAVYPAA